MQDGNAGAKSATVTVSVAGDGYSFVFAGGGFDRDGNVEVRGPRNGVVPFQFTLVAGDGLSAVRFPADGGRAVRVGNSDACPPSTDNPQFDQKQTGPGNPGGPNTVLRFRDRMTERGDYAYALTVEVTRADGTTEQATHDPMVANRPN